MQKRKSRSVQKNKMCGLLRDDFLHVKLWFGTKAKSKSNIQFDLERGNLLAVHYSHVNEGKLTIELKQPPVTIFIDPSSESLRVDSDAGKVRQFSHTLSLFHHLFFLS